MTKPRYYKMNNTAPQNIHLFYTDRQLNLLKITLRWLRRSGSIIAAGAKQVLNLYRSASRQGILLKFHHLVL